jgi:hypothetical protein
MKFIYGSDSAMKGEKGAWSLRFARTYSLLPKLVWEQMPSHGKEGHERSAHDIVLYFFPL